MSPPTIHTARGTRAHLRFVVVWLDWEGNEQATTAFRAVDLTAAIQFAARRIAHPKLDRGARDAHGFHVRASSCAR